MVNKPSQESEEKSQITKELSSLKKQNAQLSQAGFELISEQSKLQSLLHNAADGIISFASDGTVDTFNIAAQHIFGFSEGEVVRRKIPDLIPCPDWVEDNVAAYIRYFISSRASSDIPLLGKHRMGFDILLDISTGQAVDHDTILFDESDEVDPFADDDDKNDIDTEEDNIVVCFLRDITLDKKLELELENHKHALDFSAGIIVQDKDFRVIEINDKFSQISGKSRHIFLGQQNIHYKFSSPPSSELQLRQRHELLAQGNPWVGETGFLNNQGEQIWFAESITPFLDKDNIPYQYLSILFDITVSAPSSLHFIFGHPCPKTHSAQAT